MVTVRIGETERGWREARPDWINQEINRRRADGRSPCVEVRIRCGDIEMRLATPTCPRGNGVGRAPTEDERRIFLLWQERGLDGRDFTGGHLVAFLRQLEDLIGAC